jgi:outer membrane protein OmpA-like peptidoglycan-associated protein
VYDPASDEPREKPKKSRPVQLSLVAAFLALSFGILYFAVGALQEGGPPTLTPGTPTFPDPAKAEPSPRPVPPEILIDSGRVPKDPAEQQRFMASVWHQRGLAAFGSGDRTTARQAWRRCLVIDRANAACWEGLRKLEGGPSYPGLKPAQGAVNYSLHFAAGSGEILPDDSEVLDRVADTLELYPLDSVTVTAYATTKEGIGLAVARGTAVRGKLEEKSVSTKVSVEARLSDGPDSASAVIVLRRP